ncbi:MAG TPA: lipid A biosynthesis protein [Rhodospirillaceae bacterium]|nr:MAG: hypothetical protein A2018_04475 [Alphaproteobacteria bacterium GWF2_58_20]HAU28775.1 lipid A biosynthesis protein [Rhodospirillaceae bacterium]
MLEKLLTVDNVWLAIGFFGQALFMMRFVIQIIQSEKQKRSVIPVAFWFFSVGGALVLLSYAIYKRDPVFIAGQGLGLTIYARNIWFILLDHKNPNRKPENRMLALVDEMEGRGMVDPALAEMRQILAK